MKAFLRAVGDDVRDNLWMLAVLIFIGLFWLWFAPAGNAQTCSSTTGNVAMKLFIPPHPAPSNEVQTTDPGVVITTRSTGAVYQLEIEGDRYAVRAIIEVTKEYWDSVAVGDEVPWLDPSLPVCPAASPADANDQG